MSDELRFRAKMSLGICDHFAWLQMVGPLALTGLHPFHYLPSPSGWARQKNGPLALGTIDPSHDLGPKARQICLAQSEGLGSLGRRKQERANGPVVC